MIDDTIKHDTENTIVTTIAEEKTDTAQAIVKESLKPEDKDVVDVDLGFVEKRRFRIAGDYNRMLELNVSDLNVFKRLNDSYPKLQRLVDDAQNKVMGISEDDKDGMLSAIADALEYIDKEMRNLIDYIFDAEVSKVVAPSGNMFDPINGQYRFERVIDIVTGLYTNNLNSEFNKMKNRVNSRTNKYTKKSKK